MFSQMVIEKLVQDQGADSTRTLASLSDGNIAAICDVMKRPGGLVSTGGIKCFYSWQKSQAFHVHVQGDKMLL